MTYVCLIYALQGNQGSPGGSLSRAVSSEVPGTFLQQEPTCSESGYREGKGAALPPYPPGVGDRALDDQGLVSKAQSNMWHRQTTCSGWRRGPCALCLETGSCLHLPQSLGRLVRQACRACVRRRQLAAPCVLTTSQPNPPPQPFSAEC